ncbi:hypothetical protein SPSIL_014830 [Sporomusa silvacetica DSM 10669]|uniref:Uncharacterized protein n=1 Tax=Sporomusa silvacetica DSM 10669 TaxID=1123289 RepID=A0ABZ3IJ22_9FIRM|nr:hypothetical protein [Sporomusa silvacetica]OZC21545.1 hypothetical protein SPSIL_09560 [Sporomusa silvacetica DSM 10669]
MKRILHRNPRTQKYLNTIFLAGISSVTFADLDKLNDQRRKDAIVRRQAA